MMKSEILNLMKGMLLLFLLLATFQNTFAQQVTVTGSVKDVDGNPLVGVRLDWREAIKALSQTMMAIFC